MFTDGTTVCAVSTPFGRGGIAVLRVSGKDAVSIAGCVFSPGPGQPLSDLPAGQMVWGRIYAEGRQIDDGMAVCFRGPHSYTGEDTVEISCHGGILLTEKVLSALLAAGASPAGPGEFTKRAFLNGKLGLTQAEAVIDLIDAQSEEKLRLAGAGARGNLRRETDGIFSTLKDVLASTYAYIDYPDEDLTDMTPAMLSSSIEAVRARLSRLKATYTSGHAVNEGIPAAIVGKPNTGKSSLLNALLGRDRAIVTDIAGTTRDVLEETVVLGRVMLRLSDTAGIRETDDTVERMGVERSLSALSASELVIAVFDTSRPMDEEDTALGARLQGVGCPVICVENKSDLPRVWDTAALGIPFAKTLVMQAKGGDTSALREAVEALFVSGDIDYERDAVLSNARQYAAVSSALSSVERASEALAKGYTQDIACLDLELALSSLGEVDGRSVSGEIVDAIFHNFCVGK